jgi:2-polyprenyl-3-methyl-5-hydroxy-6-metoxy-1,4-benzoquinol methylase
MTVTLAHIGDRLGLFADLDRNGPATSAELAARTSIDERYAREWLHGLASAGYLERTGDGRFALPPEHAPALAAEGGPFFVGGALQMLPAMLGPMDRLVEAFRSGGGVPQDAYDPAIWEGMERFSACYVENHLVQTWIPAAPELEAKLRAGARVADVGCGAGGSVIKLAQAYPASTFVGYDAFEGQLVRARENARRAGVADRVRFELLDAAAGLPERYDVITTFDVVHDAVDPRGLLRSIRAALEPDGRYLLVEVRSEDDPAANVGPLAAMFYGVSVLYCMTTSLAHGGEGFGTCGLPAHKVRELGLETGYSAVDPLPVDDPFNALYQLTP